MYKTTNTHSTTSITFGLFLITLLIGFTSCKDFLSTKPEDTLSVSDFYKTNAQVDASTNILYGSVWFQYNDKFAYAVSELMSGNARSYAPDVTNFGSFSLGDASSSNEVLLQGWQSFWTVVAQANSLINNLPKQAGSEVDTKVLNNALGEAHTMRAMAYFFLVRNWGPVPIIENNIDYVYSPQVPRNPVDDIYKFIRQDLQFGIDNLRDVSEGLSNGGHVTKNSAKALLAKVELYRKNYAKAKKLSEDVINSGEFKLMDNYADLYKVENNNNPETIIALQWSDADFGRGNSRQAFFALNSTLTGTGTGYAFIGPTIDLQNAYENNDKRRKPTIMLGGNNYPELIKADGGFTVPNDVSAQGTDAAIKKYVVGTPADNGGMGSRFSSVINTYLLRYADVLLINAEATLGNAKYGDGKSTSDTGALTSFNMVRKRAGLGTKSSITKKDIIDERRIEFAIEDDYWYDLGRLDRQKAIDIISDQERGTFNNAPRSNPPDISSIKYTPTDKDFTLPYPSVDVAVNKFLKEDPQPYDFGKK